jgi:hypothetical protein
MRNNMTLTRKLELIIEMLESKEVGIAKRMVFEWGCEQIRGHHPEITPFERNDERMYWMEYEPMLSDLKEALERSKQ